MSLTTAMAKTSNVSKIAMAGK